MWKKLVTAIRGGANEAVEAVVDSQGMRILDQEIRDAKSEIDKAESQLAKLMGETRLTEKEVADLKAQYNNYSAKAKQADEALAEKIKEKMLEIHSEFTEKKTILEAQENNVVKLKALLKTNQKKVEAAERKVSTLKAQESLNKVTESLVTNTNSTSSNLSAMASTLDRMEKKQTKRAAELDALQELEADASGASLDAEIEAAGLGNSVKKADLPDEL